MKWLLKKLLTVERATDLVIEWINKLLSRIKDAEKAKDIAVLIERVSVAVDGVAALLKGESLREAVKKTAAVVTLLATAVQDLKVTAEEVDGLVDSVKDMVAAWKEWSESRGQSDAE